jgi:hypothetical protein
MANNSFFKFLFGFMMIIAAAWGILVLANSQMKSVPGVDSVAHPR